jgi:hypothetical protein
MRLATILRMASLMTFWAVPAWAQLKFGQVLDSGATKLSADEFTQQVVGRYLEGPARSGLGSVEIVYLNGGVLRGSGSGFPSPAGGALGGGATYAIEGTWTIDERGRVCETTRIGGMVLAPRCQWWFRQSEKYYVTDSDWDRSAYATIRMVKKM